MKAYQVCWTITTLNKYDDSNSGLVIVVAASLTRAISRFEREYDPRRVIESVILESKEVLIEGADS